jgi:hypothetical protein
MRKQCNAWPLYFPVHQDDVNPPSCLLTMLPEHINHANAVNVQHMQKHLTIDMPPQRSPFAHKLGAAILTEGLFVGCRFALLEAAFGIGLHCRVDVLVLPFPPSFGILYV